MSNESAEKKEEKPWWEQKPYCSKWLGGEGETYKLPAIIAEAQRLERERIKKIVEVWRKSEANATKPKFRAVDILDRILSYLNPDEK